jgi:radical SAM superfamily enzyme YgiQ (UPF0313 family)
MANILLISYDNGSHLPFFPLNLFYLHGHLAKSGTNTVGIYHQDLHHGPDKALLPLLDENPWDLIGVGMTAGYYQYAKLKSLSKVVSASKRRSKFQYMLGGHGPAAEPEFFINKMGADTVVVGDGENGMDQALSGKNGVIHSEPCTEDDAPLFLYDRMPISTYKLIRWPTSTATDFCFPILSSRGCKWSCSFCYRMRKGFHMRSIDAIMEEIKYLHKTHQINHIQFADELLMAGDKRTAAVCEAILKLNFKIKWDCNGRLNYAKPKLLALMKKSGCEYINYGIESLNQQLLNEMGKGLTLQQINSGVTATLTAGISPGLNFIWGFPGDSTANLRAAVMFLKKYDPCDELRTIRPVTPYPGTKLYRLAIEKGLLQGPEEFYEQKHVNSDLVSVNFTDMPDVEFHRALKYANLELYENYIEKRKNKMMRTAQDFYDGKNNSFRGWRPV